MTMSARLLEPVTADWCSPEIWIFPASRAAGKWLVSWEATVAVRITERPQFARHAAGAGPLISTSAKPPGRPPALNRLAARRYSGCRVACYLAGKLLQPGVPSRIRDSRSGIALRG
ncbi:MAG: Sua5/YciO/YrdC/YwlC family protein [Gammaproteobacteria bacterium]